MPSTDSWFPEGLHPSKIAVGPDYVGVVLAESEGQDKSFAADACGMNALRDPIPGRSAAAWGRTVDGLAIAAGMCSFLHHPAQWGRRRKEMVLGRRCGGFKSVQARIIFPIQPRGFRIAPCYPRVKVRRWLNRACFGQRT